MINLHLLIASLFIFLGTSKLAYVATVFRHGARYPTGNMFDGKQTAAFHGQLTVVGMRQQYLLGSYLKSQYIDKAKLINSTLYPKEVQVFSQSSERCVESTIAHLLGMFPFGTGPILPEGIDKQLLDPPFESFLKQSLRRQVQEEFGGEFALDKGFQPVPYKSAGQFFPSCPNEAIILGKRAQSVAKQVAQLQLEQAAFTQKMRLVFNLSVEESNVAGLAELFDVVTCDMYLGRPLPAQFSDYDYAQLKFIQNYLFTLVYGGEPAKVFSTNLVSAILNNMDNRVKKGKDQVKKYSVYSGHDTNVAPLLMFFNLTSPECIKKTWLNETTHGNCAESPPFAANLIFQLHQSDTSSDYFVKIRSDGKYMNACDDQVECPYAVFAERARSNFADVAKECGFKNEGIKVQES